LDEKSNDTKRKTVRMVAAAPNKRATFGLRKSATTIIAARQSSFTNISHSCGRYQWKGLNDCTFTSAIASKETACRNVYIALSS